MTRTTRTRRHGFDAWHAALLMLASLILLPAAASQAADFGLGAPHNETNNMYCDDCHGGLGGFDGLLLPRDAEQEAMCKSCHNPLGQAASMSNVGNHEVDGGARVIDCGSCHNVHGWADITDPHTGTVAQNLSYIRADMAKYVAGAVEPAIFRDDPLDAGSLNTYVFDAGPFGGVCQSCHQNTTHWRNDALENPHHNLGTTCTDCHSHENGFGHGATSGTGCGDTASCHGTRESHPTHILTYAEGGMLGVSCDQCHNTANFPDFADGQTLIATSVCDDCHSPGGTYDGVSDVASGAKNNWEYGAYVDTELSRGRDKWCAGCHDEVPSVINGVAAPNVVGDEDADTYYGTGIGYGYYKTGHGLPPTDTYPASGGMTPGAGMLCTECHDRDMAHVDGVARTYDATVIIGDPNDYQHGYRLKSVDDDIPMEIPREAIQDGGSYRMWAYESQFRLCLKCHDASQYMEPYDAANPDATYTNFFKLTMDRGFPNMHDYHIDTVGSSANGPRYDSDYDVVIGDDSRISCPACHNVHGSNYLAMMRDGKLVNKEPGMPTFYTDANTVISGNDWGGCGKPEDTGLTLGESTGTTYNGRQGMCAQCHGGCWRPYDRVPANYAQWNDADGDSTMDSVDNCPVDIQATQDDSDGDGWGDVCDLCPSDPLNVNDTSIDTDFDGVGDNCDVCPNDPLNDPDGDGLCETDICPYDYDNDFDGDGVCGDEDNCPGDANAAQGDTDADGVGDACDNCPDNFNPDQIDSYADGTGDACGPGFVTLHPSGVVDDTQFDILGSTPWESALDSNDGDRSLVLNINVDNNSEFSVSMDDTAGTLLEGATILSIRIYAYARFQSGGSGTPVSGDVDLGYNTGTNTVWNGNTLTQSSYDYSFIESAVFTTDSDGGPLDTTDIDNLQILLHRYARQSTSWQVLVTEVYVEVGFTR